MLTFKSYSYDLELCMLQRKKRKKEKKNQQNPQFGSLYEKAVRKAIYCNSLYFVGRDHSASLELCRGEQEQVALQSQSKDCSQAEPVLS